MPTFKLTQAFRGREDRQDGCVWLKDGCAYEQASIRAVCTIIDAFHFPLPPKADLEAGKPVPASPAVDGAAVAEQPLSAAGLEAAQDVQKVLVKQVTSAASFL